ncbi:YihY family inner membrane protein [Rhodanobacter sp. 7MK24]|uniref:YihY family inner membrane protein n=1 Tax=Rhodanobacter sp. 7MK24 TaxID=2775922 RepID=UPI001787614C|nr:YihY family inner membrane protein [Rhodanobacter sp. 7MK24]MBD8881363.1 YihY family inner membrane protein [Rhodanobacter sp. 7MK24]
MQLRFDRDRTHSFGHFLWQRFVDDKCFETAGALSYTTLVSLVPLMVAALAMFAAFPVFAQSRDLLLDFVFRNFVPAAGHHIQDALQGFAGNASQLTGISILMMLFSAISMMVSIEDRLNRIWRVQRPRRWAARLLLYWAALTLGPVLVGGGIAASSYLSAQPLLQGSATVAASSAPLRQGAAAVAASPGLGTHALRVVPFVATFVSLWLMYVLVPNRRVSRRDATVGALVAAILFEFARWGFRLFVHGAHTYQQIYGKALAAIPIFLVWIYLSWIIVILGASIAASISAYEYEPPAERLPEGAEFLGLMVVLKHFVDAQRRGESVDPASICASEPRLRTASAAVYVDDLVRAGLVQRNESGGWLLSRSLDSADLLRVYLHTRYRLPLQPTQEATALNLPLPPELLAMLDELATAMRSTLGTPLLQVFPAALAAPEESSP